jgi:predicted nucleotidyltransferase
MKGMRSLVTPDSAQLQAVVERLREKNGDEIAVVLVGSVARGCSNEDSDVDLLVIGKERPKVADGLSGLHIQVSSETEFNRNLILGEDFEAWCLRFGVPLYDRGIWARLRRLPIVWPKWQAKIPHGARRLFMANALFEMGDLDAATEETVYALGHVARGLLLKAGVFPLSRPELAEQVRSLGYPHLARIHEELRRHGRTSPKLIRLAQRYGKKLLSGLDRSGYAHHSSEYRSKRRAKSGRKARSH